MSKKETNDYINILCENYIYVSDIIELFNEKNIDDFKIYLDKNSNNFNWRDVEDIDSWYDWFVVELNKELKEYEEYEITNYLDRDIGDIFKEIIEDRDIDNILIKLKIDDFENLNLILPNICYIMTNIRE